MTCRNILLLIAILAFCLTLSAQEEFNSSSALGFHFGTLTGSGYAMRWMGERIGIQGTFGAYTIRDDDVKFAPNEYFYDEDQINTLTRKGRETGVNLGLTGMYFLDKFGFLERYYRGRLYIIAGGSYKYYQLNRISMDYQESAPGNSYYTLIEGSRHKHTKVEHRWTAGAGPGFEFHLGKKFALAFEIPFTFNWKHEIVMYVPQAGVYYYFK